MTTRHMEGKKVEKLYPHQEFLQNNKYAEPEIAEEICEAIFMLIPGVTRLKELFLGWSTLPQKDRELIDEKLQHPDFSHLYKPLREALIRYESVQDTQGAPGCEPGMVNFFGDPQLEEGLTAVIQKLEHFLTVIASHRLESDGSEDSDEPDDDASSIKTIQSSSNIKCYSTSNMGNVNDIIHNMSNKSISLDNIL
ncbi:hypothetical protein LSTR_LSTR001889 [Laodelphax striatellus]|uniref:Uncharacterized protein n=1 Tax=Laodelphax striatellus TaxID=195883 RepID=A0A482WFW0_LAOST|nr:hypothetical protein LSTR_LSTR001889 [Laodelphax striatellus]